MYDATNRMKCDCRDCQHWAEHVFPTLLDGQFRERHLCPEHFAFVCRTYPGMVEYEGSAELPISDSEFESFLRGDNNK